MSSIKVTLRNHAQYTDLSGVRRVGVPRQQIEVTHTEALELHKQKAIDTPPEFARVVVEPDEPEDPAPVARSRRRGR